MKVIHWINPGGGDFDDGADWSGGVVPGARNRAVIDAPGAYTVTISSAEAVKSLTLDDASATVSFENGATLAVGSSLTLRAGTFELNGTVSGGTVSAKKGTFSWLGGAFDGVTYDGPLDVTERRSRP